MVLTQAQQRMWRNRAARFERDLLLALTADTAESGRERTAAWVRSKAAEEDAVEEVTDFLASVRHRLLRELALAYCGLRDKDDEERRTILSAAREFQAAFDRLPRLN